jgi:hypothetical protein
MALSHVEIERIFDFYDVYDLVEILDLSVKDIVYMFEEKIEDCEEIMERVSETQVDSDESD